MKTNLTVVTRGYIKMLVNASIQDLYLQSTVESKTSPLVDGVPNKKGKYVDGSFSFASVYSIILFSSLINGVWLSTTTMNGIVCEFTRMVNLVINVVSFFVIIVMSQVIIIQEGNMDDTGQVRWKYPHFISK
jgi:hypothetical protein